MPARTIADKATGATALVCRRSSGSRAVMAEHGVCDLTSCCFGPRSHQLPQLKDRPARTPAAVGPPRSLRGRAEATYQPVIAQRDANGLRHLETNRPQLQHDPAVDMHRALYPLRLRVVESHHITHSAVTCRDVLDRHRRTYRRRTASAGPTPQRLLSGTDDPAAALRYPP